MGATSSKDMSSKSNGLHSSHMKNKSQDLVDFGTVFPNGLYTTTPQDFDSRILRQLILTRKLSPFYQGLPDVPEHVTSPLPSPEQSSTSPSISSLPPLPPSPSPQERSMGAPCRNNKLPQGEPHHQINTTADKTRLQQKAMLYNDAVECPICFLYYPPNINYSRCCEQPICTECFIQIHRPTEDSSNPATCPFCLESNYGITYTPPAWSDKNQTSRARSLSSSSSISTNSPSSPTGARHTTSGISDGSKPRRKSVSHTHPNVVLIDHIRPSWHKPPTTPSRSSRRNSLTTAHTSSSSASSSGRNLLRAVTRPGRSASSAASTEYNQRWANVRDMNMDLEEWMVMEAIRLSLAEQEEQEQARMDSTTTTSSSSSLEEEEEEQGQAPTTITQQQHDDDDDDRPLAERVNHYKQTAVTITAPEHRQQQEHGDSLVISSSPLTATTSSISSQDSMDQQDHASDKKSTSEHDPSSSVTTTTTPTPTPTTTTTTATSGPDMVY